MNQQDLRITIKTTLISTLGITLFSILVFAISPLEFNSKDTYKPDQENPIDINAQKIKELNKYALPPYFTEKEISVLIKELNTLSQSQINDMDETIEILKIPQEYIPYAQFIYQYRYGYFSDTNDAKYHKYSSSLHDFNTTTPTSWHFRPGGGDKPYFVAPYINYFLNPQINSLFVYGPFEVVFHKLCKECLGGGRTLQKYGQDYNRSRNRQYPLLSNTGPTQTKLGEWNATQYTYTIANENIDIPEIDISELGNFHIEDYFFEADGVIFLAYIRYFEGLKDEYYDTATQIITSLEPGTKPSGVQYFNLDIIDKMYQNDLYSLRNSQK